MVHEGTVMSGIIRVYKRDDEGVLHFREGWYDEDYSQFVMNYGVVGHQSKTEETDVADAAAVEGLMDAFAVQCTANASMRPSTAAASATSVSSVLLWWPTTP